MNKNSFLDAYFGEIYLLARDVYKAPGLKNKFLYLIMPPGWNHTGHHKTAKIVRKEYLEQHPAEPLHPSSLAASEPGTATRSEEHTSELQSLMRHSYAVFC